LRKLGARPNQLVAVIQRQNPLPRGGSKCFLPTQQRKSRQRHHCRKSRLYHLHFWLNWHPQRRFSSSLKRRPPVCCYPVAV
jgi:hypothetical protein